MYQGPLMPFLPVEITAPFSQENAGTRTAAGVCDAGMSVCQVSPFQLNPCARVRLSKGTKFSVHDERESYLFTSEIICPGHSWCSDLKGSTFDKNASNVS